LITSFANPILSNFAKFYHVLPKLVKTWQNDVALKTLVIDALAEIMDKTTSTPDAPVLASSIKVCEH
jgi:hypothetical protein